MDFVRNALIAVWNIVAAFAMKAFFIVGVILIIAEILIPGVGALGVCGAACIVIAIILFSSSLLQAVLLSAAAIAVIGALLFLSEAVFAKILGVRRKGNAKGGIPVSINEGLIGKCGVALSDINPAGTADIGEGEVTVSCVDGKSILKGERIKIVGISGGVVFVEKCEGE